MHVRACVRARARVCVCVMFSQRVPLRHGVFHSVTRLETCQNDSPFKFAYGVNYVDGVSIMTD